MKGLIGKLVLRLAEMSSGKKTIATLVVLGIVEFLKLHGITLNPEEQKVLESALVIAAAVFFKLGLNRVEKTTKGDKP